MERHQNEVGMDRTTVGIVAGVVAAAVAPLVYGVWIRFVAVDQLVPTILMGVIVGLVMRFAIRQGNRSLGLTAAGLAAVATIAGYMVGEYLIYTPFMVQPAVQRLLGLVGILCVGASLYLAYILVATKRGPKSGDTVR